MSGRTLAGLILCNLVVYSYGNGFIPLMPVYAQRFGANSEQSGYYIALAYIFLAVGTFLGGRISDAVRDRRALLAVSGLALAPFTWVLGAVGTLLQLTLVNGVQWFLAGVCLAVIGAIAGREATERERGKVFGLLGTTISLGALLGGLTMGRMADAWGYPGMLSISAGFILLIPVAAIVLLPKERPVVSEHRLSKARSFGPVFTVAFLLLLISQVFTTFSNAEGSLGRSIAMNAFSFRGADITATAAIGGLVSLPLPFLTGWLSDRIGRKPVMIASPLFGAASLVLLLVSRALWQFCAVAVLSGLMVIGATVGPAMVADVVRRERVGTGIAFFQSSFWIGFIVGYASSGLAFQRLGMRAGLGLGILCTFLAVPLLLAMRTAKPALAIPNAK